jgi:hypothetical protein
MSSASSTWKVAVLGFLVLFLEGHDVSSLGYATPAIIEAWHLNAPQFTTAVPWAQSECCGARSAPQCLAIVSVASPCDRVRGDVRDTAARERPEAAGGFYLT